MQLAAATSDAEEQAAIEYACRLSLSRSRPSSHASTPRSLSSSVGPTPQAGQLAPMSVGGESLRMFGRASATQNFRYDSLLSAPPPPPSVYSSSQASTPRNYRYSGLVGIASSSADATDTSSAASTQPPQVPLTAERQERYLDVAGEARFSNSLSRFTETGFQAPPIRVGMPASPGFARPPPIITRSDQRSCTSAESRTTSSSRDLPHGFTHVGQLHSASSPRNFAERAAPLSPYIQSLQRTHAYADRALPPTPRALELQTLREILGGAGTRPVSMDLDHASPPAPRTSTPSLIRANFMRPPSVQGDDASVSSVQGRLSAAGSNASLSATLGRTSHDCGTRLSTPEEVGHSLYRSSLTARSISSQLSQGVVIGTPRNAHSQLRAPSLDNNLRAPSHDSAHTGTSHEASLSSSDSHMGSPAAHLHSLEAYVRHDVFSNAHARPHRSPRSAGSSALIPPPIHIAEAAARCLPVVHASPVSIATTTPTAVQVAVEHIEAELVRQGSSRKLTAGSPRKLASSSSRLSSAGSGKY
jgi:hypothetical protein